ncbi:hypothetical protein ABT354_23300 [Streptomyces sp. NPDC000594]|uniref:hypothetical protein n=1 Tax=Streptomyces sp. NPDC000594 TaxID=3154261 RepID=UPI00332F2D44
MLVPEVSPIPMPTEHPGRVQVVTRGRARETQVLNLSNAEAREWATSAARAKGTTGAGLQKQTASPADEMPADPWSLSIPEPPPAPAADPAADGDPRADIWSLTPPTAPPAADTTVPPPANPAPAPEPDDAAVGLRKAQQDHLVRP